MEPTKKPMGKHRLLVLNGVLVLALAGGTWGRRSESATVARPDFLRPLKLPFRDWESKDDKLSPAEQSMLEPDATLLRQYRGKKKGQWAQLAVIAGHRKKTVHSPGFCMVGGGYELLAQRNIQIPLPTQPDAKITATQALLTKDGHGLLATYFFTDGELATNSLVSFQGAQIVKRVRGESPLGAVVRILVAVDRDAGGAEKLAGGCALATLPQVMGSLTEARLPVRQRPGREMGRAGAIP